MAARDSTSQHSTTRPRSRSPDDWLSAPVFLVFPLPHCTYSNPCLCLYLCEALIVVFTLCRAAFIVLDSSGLEKIWSLNLLKKVFSFFLLIRSPVSHLFAIPLTLFWPDYVFRSCFGTLFTLICPGKLTCSRIHRVLRHTQVTLGEKLWLKWPG